jgi:nucleotide-binding universal stress UspA family protein
MDAGSCAVGPSGLVPSRRTERGRDRRAEEGAAGARQRGYNASARIAQANESVATTIDEIAQEIDAGLVVCGQRGRGAIGSALLGSVSHALAAHTKRPVLIAPQHPS